ncbi:MAG: hypothetical protein P0S95_08370 [Rhabdochlamydiaceae bacterium]|nr:hypothetical protein [Candidatus Amphrikana amoebophyrae]
MIKKKNQLFSFISLNFSLFNWNKLLFSKQFILSFVALFAICFSFIVYSIVQIDKQILSSAKLLDSLGDQVAIIRDDHNMRNLFKKRLTHSDPNFLDLKISSIIPFDSELSVLEDVTKFSAFKGFSPIQNRINYLHQGEGQFSLTKVSEHKIGGFLESFYFSASPIINESDLKLLISTVEGKQLSYIRPQLFFKKLALHRVKDNEDREAYSLNFELVKRDKFNEK